MTIVTCIANQKGGVGKTTTTVNLAAYLALAGHSVLVVDLDPQGNCSSVLAPPSGGASLLAGGTPLETGRQGIACIPSDGELVLRERRLGSEPGQRLVIRDAIAHYIGHYDYILLDCPPSLSLLPVGGLVAADSLVIPIQCEYYAMEGLGQILGTVGELANEGYDKLRRVRVLLGMYDPELLLARQVAADVRQHLGEQVFATAIPRDVALAAAPSHRRTVIEHDPLSPGSLAYCSVTKELLDAC